MVHQRPCDGRQAFIGAHAQHQLAVCPWLIESDGFNGQRLPVQRCTLAGQHAHAKPRRHHEAQGVIAGHLDAQFQRHVQLRSAACELCIDGAARVCAHKVIGQRLAHADAAVRGQRVASGGNQDQLVLPVGGKVQFAAIAAGVEDAKVCGVLGDGQRDLRADFFLQMHLHIRVLAQKALQLLWQKLRDGRDVGHHAHMAAHAAAVFAHLACNAVDLAQHTACQIQQGIGRSRGCDAAIAALEQAHLQLGFQL